MSVKKNKQEESFEDVPSIKIAVSKSLSSKKLNFDLTKFKKSKNLNRSVRYKDQEWLVVSKAFQEATGVPGIPVGHITVVRGHSDTGKTTLLLEAAVSAQKLGKIPVLIVTEMKWDWTHAKIMGFEFEEVVDTDSGELTYDGNFIYVDRSSLNTIEDVAAFIADLMDEQNKGKLPADLVFLWDAVGTIPCQLSLDSKKNNNEWNAGAISTQFGNYIDQQIIMSRKQESKYTNTFVIVNKIWVMKPQSYGEMPKLKNKGGETFYSDSTLVITFGNVTNQGTSKIKATKGGKEVEFGKRTKVQIEKNHVNGITTSTRIIATPHGFIHDDKKAIDEYKKIHSEEWASILGGGNFEIVEEVDMKEDIRDLSDNIVDVENE